MAIARSVKIAARLAAELPVSIDRLPYTSEFEAYYTLFQTEFGRPCSRWEAWWSLVDARKRGMIGALNLRPWGPPEAIAKLIIDLGSPLMGGAHATEASS